MVFTVDDIWQGKTIKQYLFGELKLTRAQVTALKKDPLGILYNGSHATVRQIMTKGGLLEISLGDNEQSINREIEPVDLPFGVVYEDEWLIIADKPYNMPVHPSYNHRNDSLANAVAYYYMKHGQVSAFRAVNRLDRDTSGLVIVAKDRMTANRLSVAIGNGNVKKEYLAILEGRLTGEGRIESYIKRERESIITRISCSEGIASEYALTTYRSVYYSEERDITAVIASPVTGRTHQLRVHFASIGHGIAGDTLYAHSSPYIERQALHAYSLEFVHPHTGKTMKIIGDIPEDIKKALLKEGFDDFKKSVL